MSDIHSKSHRLFTIQDLLDWTPPAYTRIIHDGVLNTQNRMLIFGDEGTWKSILALHMQHCVARGSQWIQFNTTPSNVLRLQVELPQYTDRERVQKYCLHSKSIYQARYRHAVSDTSRLDQLATAYAYPSTAINRTEQFIHIDESSGWEQLKQDIENCIIYLPSAPLVVILDPLFKMFNRDLNNETDMKPLLDKIDIIMADTKHIPGISFVIVHHTRKSITDTRGAPIQLGSQDATGSRALVRWCDTVLRIDPDFKDRTQSRVRLTFTKHRNAEEVLPIITAKWNRSTLHPRIIYREIPVDENEEEEAEVRGDQLLSELE